MEQDRLIIAPGLGRVETETSLDRRGRSTVHVRLKQTPTSHAKNGGHNRSYPPMSFMVRTRRQRYGRSLSEVSPTGPVQRACRVMDARRCTRTGSAGDSSASTQRSGWAARARAAGNAPRGWPFLFIPAGCSTSSEGLGTDPARAMLPSGRTSRRTLGDVCTITEARLRARTGLFAGSKATAFKTDNGRSALVAGTGLHAPLRAFKLVVHLARKESSSLQ